MPRGALACPRSSMDVLEDVTDDVANAFEADSPFEDACEEASAPDSTVHVPRRPVVSSKNFISSSVAFPFLFPLFLLSVVGTGYTKVPGYFCILYPGYRVRVLY